ncbi:MAG: enoyl-CoA hydratase-related protein [Mycobacteriales bacterium]
MIDLVLAEVRDDGVALLTLNRPDRKNAWSAEMEHRYFGLLDELDRDERVRAVVLTGSGSSFCPGMDTGRLEQVAGGPLRQDGRRSPYRPWALRKPMIAAINGGCAGIGLVQALLCDVRFAARGARLATAFTRRGLAGEYGITWLLPRLVGTGVATELLISGRTVEADEAAALGLVHRVLEPTELMSFALSYAADLAANCAPTSMALMRHQLHLDAGPGLAAALGRSYLAMAHTVADVDLAEGVASMVERRAPSFRPLPDGYDPAAIVGAGSDVPHLRPEDLLPS